MGLTLVLCFGCKKESSLEKRGWTLAFNDEFSDSVLNRNICDLKCDDNNNYSCIKWVSRLNVCTFSVMKDFMNRAAFIDIQKGHVLKYVNN